MNLAGLIATALTGAMLAACNGSPPGGGPDGGLASDGGGNGGDGGSGSGDGLRLVFQTDPAVPGTVGGDFDVTVSSLEFHLDNLRVVGDAAPGDDRTRIGNFTASWPGSDPEVRFGQAPPGLYSYVLADLTEYEMKGSATVDIQRGFSIEDEGINLQLSIPLSVVLEPNGSEDIAIVLSLSPVLGELRWDEADVNAEGKYDVDGELRTFMRNQLVDAFQAGSLQILKSP
jgi:hypothetical protein